MKCTFGEKYSTLALAIYAQTSGDWSKFVTNDKLKEELSNVFTDPDKAEAYLRKKLGGEEQTPPPVPSGVVLGGDRGDYSVDENTDNIMSYYLERTQYDAMVRKFKTDLLGNCIFKINDDGSFTFIAGNEFTDNNITLAQKNILAYKEGLLNKLLEHVKLPDSSLNQITLSLDVDNKSYTKLVDDVLSAFKTAIEINGRDKYLADGSYDTYVILSNFDKLISTNAPYIKISKSYKNDEREGVHKYQYSPKVSHRAGFSKEDGANTALYLSDLSESILDVIPMVDKNWVSSTTTFIGKNGYLNRMAALKRAILYGVDSLGDDTKHYKESFLLGAEALLDKDNPYNLVNAIQAFIDNNQATGSINVSNFSLNKQQIMHDTLRGISKYLFSNKTPEYIKNMFVQMFIKNESITYSAYGSDSQTGNAGRIQLAQRSIIGHKFNVQHTFSGGLDSIKAKSRLNNNIIGRNYEFKFNGSNGTEVLTITDTKGRTMEISYNAKSLYEKSEIQTSTPEMVVDVIKDMFNYVIPGSYATCMGDVGDTWINDFAPFIILGAKEYNQGLSIPAGMFVSTFNGTNRDLSKFNNALLNIGQKLSVVFGDSAKSTVRNLSGNQIAANTLTSLEYTWLRCLQDAGELNAFGEDYWDYAPISESIIFTDRDIVTNILTRGEVQVGTEVKSPTKLSNMELFKIAMVDDVILPLLENDPTICYQNATFSDKTTQYIPEYKLNIPLKNSYVYQIFGDSVTIKDLAKECISEKQPKRVLKLIRYTRRDKYTRYAHNILSAYASVFPELNIDLKADETVSDDLAKHYVAELTRIDKFLVDNKYDLTKLRKKFRDAKVTFIEETYAYKPGDDKYGKCRINETFLSFLKSVSSKEDFTVRMSRSLERFKNDIQDLIITRFSDETNNQIDRILNASLVDTKEFYDPATTEYRFVKDGKLNPLAKAYWALDLLLSNDFNSAVGGEIWAHSNKNKDTFEKENPTDYYLEFSEASRLVNQIKRTNIHGSAIHPFAQGIKDENGHYCGVTKQIRIAYIKDIKAFGQTINGKNTDDLDSQDGGGLCTGLQSRLENNSVIDSRVGENKKTIVHSMDPSTGTPTLLKWAVFTLTNQVRRLGMGSITNVENMVKKMYSIRIPNSNYDLGGEYEKYKQEAGSIYVEDPNTLQMFELVRVYKDSETGFWTQEFKTEDGTIISRKYKASLDNLYDIDQLFGGANTYIKNGDGTYSGSESSVDMLERIAIKYDLRGAQIAYAVNTSACKVGQTNVNESSAWTDDSELWTSWIDTKYGGVIMDADHELDDAEVTEMTQMMSALIEDGRYTNEVLDLYKDVANIALKNKELSKYIDALNSNDRNKLKELVSKSLIKAFQTGNKDTIGLAQAFIKQVDKEYKAADKEGRKAEYSIPFSDPTIFEAVFTNMMTTLTNMCIRRKYSGFAGVQNPSYNMIQYYIGGKTFRQFSKECRDQLFPFFPDGLPQEYSTWQNAAYNWDDPRNPFRQLITSKDIEFGDTVLINSVPKVIESFADYDYIKNVIPPQNIVKITAAPRNLQGTNLVIHVASLDGTFEQDINIWDTDIERALQYLNTEKPSNYQIAFVNRLLGIEGDTVFAPNALSRVTDMYHELLKACDYGRRRTERMSRGEQPDAKDLKAEIGMQDCLSHLLPGYTGNLVITDYKVTPAQIIIGRYQMQKLGLSDQDQVSDIKDYTYFYNKLKNHYPTPTWVTEETDIYDRILYRNGRPFLVKVGTADLSKQYPNGVPEFNTVGDDLRYESDVILSESNRDRLNSYKFHTIYDDLSNPFTLIEVPDTEALKKLSRSEFFDGVWRNNITRNNIDEYQRNIKGNYKRRHLDSAKATERLYWSLNLKSKIQLLNEWDKENFDARLIQLAKDRFEAFKQGTRFIGARIPTQAMQSFMPFEVVAFTDTEENVVYIPTAATYRHGSDYWL